MSRVSAANTPRLFTQEGTQPVTTLNSLSRLSLESTREDRAAELYAALGRFIEKVGDELFEVPSQDGRRTYEVHYGGDLEACSCADHMDLVTASSNPWATTLL